MQENKYLSTVIYPDNLENLTEDSYLIGWNTEQFHCLIAASVPRRVATNDRKLKEILEKIYHDPSYVGSRSRNIGGVVECLPPLLLGCLIVEDSETSTLPTNYQQQSSIWVTLILDKGSKRDSLENEVVLSKSKSLKASIRLESIYSVGFKYHSSCYLISYSTKDTDAFQCLKNFVGDDIYAGNNSASDFTSSFRSSNKGIEKVNMDLITQNINFSHDLKKFVDSYLEVELYGNVDGRRPWTEQLEESLVLLLGKIGSWFHLFGFVINNKISNFIPIITWASRHFQWSNIVALSAKSKASHRAERRKAEGEEESLTIHELSFFVYAISHRCSQLQKLLRQCSVFSLSWNVSVAARQFLFISIVEIAVEIMVDIIVGIVVGSALYISAPFIVYQSEHWATFITQRTLLDTIRWLNNAPGGIKLNPMITRKMGVLVEFFIKVAAKYYFACKFLILPACWLVSCLGATGFSLQVCALIDLLRLVTWPVNLSHAIFSTVFGFLMRLLYSLWLLFNGQKKNVLRERVDTYDYDPSALLFGVMLFSVMLFAIPNFAAYHYLFVTLRLGIVLVMLLLWQGLLLIKDFPWIKLLLRIVSPSLMMEESFLEMILVREEQPPVHSKPSSNNLPSEPFNQLIQELSPRLNTMSAKQQRSSHPMNASVSNRKSLAKSDDKWSHAIRDDHTSADTSNVEDLLEVAGSVPSPPLSPVIDDDFDAEENEAHDSPASISPRTRPKSGLHVFTFDQADVLASGDRVSSISQENKSLRKRGDYMQSAPVSAIAIPSANDMLDEDGSGTDEDRSMERRKTSSPLLTSQLQRDSSRSDGSKGSPKNRSSRTSVKIASPDQQRTTKRNITIDEFPMTKYGMPVGSGATVIRTGLPPSLLTPTSPLLSSSQTDRWNFSSNSQGHNISSTYFAIEQKHGRLSSIFERYLRWWSTFFVERQALARLFWMILESKPVYLRILRAPILMKQQQDHLLDAVVLQSTQRFYASLAHGGILSLSTTSNTSSSTMLTWAGVEAILAGNQSRVRPYSTRESWKDIMLLYWQMILVASQGFHDTVEQLFPTVVSSEIRDRNPDQSPKSNIFHRTVEEEEKTDDSEHSPLLSASSEQHPSTRSVHKKIAEKVNARQMHTGRRLLLISLGLLILSSILSILGMLLFGWLLVFPSTMSWQQAEVGYVQDGDHRSLHHVHLDSRQTTELDAPNNVWWSIRLVEESVYILFPAAYEWAVKLIDVYQHHMDTSLQLLSKGSFLWWTLLMPKTFLSLSLDTKAYWLSIWSTIALGRRG